MDELRELDARAAELLGINLIPPREYAMARVASRYIAETGRVFELQTGEKILMPDGKTLHQPEGSSNWNDRYMLYVAQFLGDRIKDEVDAYRYEAKHYSTSPADCAELDGEMLDKGYIRSELAAKDKAYAVYAKDPVKMLEAIDIGNWSKGKTCCEARTRAAVVELSKESEGK